MKKKGKQIQRKPKSQVLEKKEIEWTNLGRFKLFLVFLGIVLVFVFFIKNSMQERENEYNLLKSDYKITRAIITKMFVYKGKTIRVRFKVAGKTYSGSDGMFKRKNKDVGDSIYVKYYVKDPNLFVTELNKNYDSGSD